MVPDRPDAMLRTGAVWPGKFWRCETPPDRGSAAVRNSCAERVGSNKTGAQIVAILRTGARPLPSACPLGRGNAPHTSIFVKASPRFQRPAEATRFSRARWSPPLGYPVGHGLTGTGSHPPLSVPAPIIFQRPAF